ncbi:MULTISPECIES: putative holin [Halomonas]|uniref:2/3 transmembrane domain holin n=1 Tax=Halomonas halophila TaxID=29573 RepID=A0ABQ0TZN2_9GAMM|nr:MULTISPECIES: putative holin [Halomonas]MDR5889654.1 putative holin [Halomonas salina]WJY06336.1 putative holin [Halomonas halophila]GEK71577.1 hypothetical protein HHA04nite_01210 [Halomonas halophila]
MLPQTLRDKFRVGPWLVAALIMATIVGLLYPHQLGVLLWSLTKLSLGAYLGYWIDRTLFPYARPHRFSNSSNIDNTARCFTVSMLRRAIIIAAALIALGLGV